MTRTPSGYLALSGLLLFGLLALLPAGTGPTSTDPVAHSAILADGGSALPSAPGEFSATAEELASARPLGNRWPELRGDARAGLLQTEIQRMVGGSGEWAILAVSLESGERLVDLNASNSMAPASNQKLLTSAAALEWLGPDFRFPTYLLVRGPVRDGVLDGDLILFGTGDPTLGLRNPGAPTGAYAHFIEALRAEGIHEIRGDIIGDGSFFSGDPRRPSWNPDDLNDWFAAPVSALSFNENVVTLRVRPGERAGAPPRILTQPAGADLPIINDGMTVASRPSPTLLLVRDDPDEPIEIRGQIHTGGGDVWRSLTVSDPPAFAASILRGTLEGQGIQVGGIARSVLEHEGLGSAAPARNGSSPARTLAVHRSPPLPDLLDTLNKRSHNLYGELLLFTLGRLEGGDGTFEGGARALTRYLIEVVGVAEEEVHVVDGSGLSRENRSTPEALVATMERMERTPHGELFWASLPEAGNARELNRMHRSAAAGNLRAKTGTIHRTSALSGVVRTVTGEPVLFSIIVNNVPSPWSAKRIEDRIGIALSDFDRPLPAPAPALTPAGVR
jgi:serine-type D-Ala-D-Ala carboxypeptidase/endopeptidase (penicillin-binding protein 4)